MFVGHNRMRGEVDPRDNPSATWGPTGRGFDIDFYNGARASAMNEAARLAEVQKAEHAALSSAEVVLPRWNDGVSKFVLCPNGGGMVAVSAVLEGRDGLAQ